MNTDIDLEGCRIEIVSRTSCLLQLQIHFNLDKKSPYSVTSPTFTINGVINFKFTAQRRIYDEYDYLLSVYFAKNREHDKLDYTISTLGTDFFHPDGKWHLVRANIADQVFTISVEVNLTPLSNPCAVLYDDTALTDFKLLGDDGYILLHKAIAAAHSPFFKTMFEGKWKETAEGVVEVPGVPQSTLEHLKEYMYLGTVPKTCEKLLLLANCYMMEDLEHRCLFMLRSQFTKQNYLSFMEFATSHKHMQLIYEITDSLQRGDFFVKGVEDILDKQDDSSSS